MKKLFLMLLCAAFCFSLHAQTEAEQKAWMEYMTPGEVHQKMAKSAGNWKSDVTMWMEPGKPLKSTATAKNEMILGGRYLQTTHKGEFFGMPFEGIGVTGYDKAAKQFVSTWIDNMGTGVMIMKGTWSEKTKSIELKGSCVDPMTGKDMAVREVITFVDDNTETMEMWMTTNGKEVKTMEIKSTRQ